MRPLLVIVSVVAFSVSCNAQGYSQPTDPYHQELLKKHNIYVHYHGIPDKEKGDKTAYLTARIPFKPDARREVELLREVTDLSGIEFILGENKFTNDHLKVIKDLPSVKFLRVDARQLSDEEMKSIGTLSQLKAIGLESAEFTREHLNPLVALKNLKYLELTCA